MKKLIQILVPILLVALIIFSIGWYLFDYDRDFTRDMLLQQARYNDLHKNSRASAWFYNLAYAYSGRDENVAIELANQYKAAGNYTKAEVTLSKAINTTPTKELYIALCKTYVEQDKLLDAVSLLANISDPTIKTELDSLRPTAPAPDHTPGFYSQYIQVGISSSEGTLFCTTDGDYPSIAGTPYSEPLALPVGETKIYSISVADNGLVSPISIFSYTIGGVVEPAVFKDPVIEASIREILNLAPDKTIYTNDVWTIQEFTIPENTTSLEDLKLLSFLKSLTVNGRDMSSLSDFSWLTKLETLDLSGCRFPTDSLSVLAALPELTNLNLSDCSLSTVAALAGAPKLEVLDLSSNTIRNLEVIGSLSTLQELYMQHNALTALDALSSLQQLRTLDVSYNSVTSIRPLVTCTQLSILNAANNRLSDAEGAAGMPLLEELYLDYNSLASVDTLGGCLGLNKLSISNNRVSDLSPLAGLTKLTVFDFSYNTVSNLPDWPEGAALRIVDGSYNQLTSIDSLANMPDICYIYMDYNQITNVDALADCFNLVQLNVFGNSIESVSDLTDHDIIVNYDPTLS